MMSKTVNSILHGHTLASGSCHFWVPVLTSLGWTVMWKCKQNKYFPICVLVILFHHSKNNPNSARHSVQQLFYSGYPDFFLSWLLVIRTFIYLKLVGKTEGRRVHCQMWELERECASLLGHKNQQRNCKLRSNRMFVLKLHNIFKESVEKEPFAWQLMLELFLCSGFSFITEIHTTLQNHVRSLILIRTIGDRHHTGSITSSPGIS